MTGIHARHCRSVLAELLPLRGREQGGSLIEIAIVLPVFILLLFGFFAFSMILCGYGSATYGARAGSRFASVGSASSLNPCNASAVQTLVNSYLYTPAATTVVVATTWTPDNSVGSTVNVSIQITYSLALPFLGPTQVSVGSTSRRSVVR